MTPQSAFTGLHELQNIDAAHPGHADIQQDHIGRILIKDRDGFIARVDGFDRIADSGQKHLHHAADGRFVVHHQNFRSAVQGVYPLLRHRVLHFDIGCGPSFLDSAQDSFFYIGLFEEIFRGL